MKLTYQEVQDSLQSNGHDVLERNERDISINCPFCPAEDPDTKFRCYITPEHDYGSIFNCFRCGESGSIHKLFRRLGIQVGKITLDTGTMRDRIIKAKRNRDFSPLKKSKLPKKLKRVPLPREYTPLDEGGGRTWMGRQALKYLKKRKLTLEDIHTWRIGYCASGSYADHIILPVMEQNGTIAFFQGRRFLGSSGPKSKNPISSPFDLSKSDLFYGMNQLHLDSSSSNIILVEGPFDVISMRKKLHAAQLFNWKPLAIFGHLISKLQIQTLASLQPNSIYVMMDADATRDGIKMARTMTSWVDCPVYSTELDGGDPDELPMEKLLRSLLNSSVQKPLPDLEKAAWKPPKS